MNFIYLRLCKYLIEKKRRNKIDKMNSESIVNFVTEKIKEIKTNQDNLFNSRFSYKNEELLKRFSLLNSRGFQSLTYYNVMQHVHPDEKIRQASVKVGKMLSEFQSENLRDKNLYKGLSSIDKSKLNSNQNRVLNMYLHKFEMNGVGLNDENMEKFKELSKKKIDLMSKANEILTEEKSEILVSKYELAGLPKDFIERTKVKDSEMCKLTHNYPDIMPVLEYCDNQYTRKKCFMKLTQERCQGTITILSQLLGIRKRMANLLGFENNTDYKTKYELVSGSENVNKFLNKFLNELAPETEKYTNELKELKTKDSELEFAEWDYLYYHTKNLKENHGLDTKIMSDYFPSDHIVNEMFKFFGNLLNVRFTERTENLPFEVWHNSVKCFTVYDTTDTPVDNEQKELGTIYLDLYPRDGKNGHAFAYDLINGYYDFEKKEQVLPSVLLLTNISDKKLSLLDIETLFHEFGHAIHGVLSGKDSQHYETTIDGVETDFIEAPSQFIEVYLRNPKVIKDISKHHSTGESIPDNLLNKYLNSLSVGESRKWSRVASMALFDSLIHTEDKFNNYSEQELISEYKQLMSKQLHYNPGPCNSLATWGHLMAWGYDSNYYSYVLSIVTASNLYHSLESGKRTKEEYRKLLEIGSKRPMNEVLLDFLNIKSIDELSIDTFKKVFL